MHGLDLFEKFGKDSRTVEIRVRQTLLSNPLNQRLVGAANEDELHPNAENLSLQFSKGETRISPLR